MPTMFAVAGAAVVSLLVACSSSSSGGGTGSVPSCQGPGATGPGSAACASCLQSSCGSQLSSEISSCGAYNGCFEACQCSDTNCIMGCFATKVDSTCQSPFGPFTMCLSQSCGSQCVVTTTPEGGTD